SGKDSRLFPRFCARAATRRLPGGIRQFRPRTAAAAILRQSGAQQSSRRARAGMGTQGGNGRRRRINSDRRRFQERARDGLAPRRLRPRRRPGALAEREIRPQMLPQGYPVLGAHPRRAREIVGFGPYLSWSATLSMPACEHTSSFPGEPDTPTAPTISLPALMGRPPPRASTRLYWREPTVSGRSTSRFTKSADGWLNVRAV